MPTNKRWTSDAELIHELRNLFGNVHVAAQTIADPETRSDPAELEEQARRLLDLTTLTAAGLVLLTSDADKMRPYDLRGAMWCAHLRDSTLSMGEVGPPVIVDGRAGDGIALSLELTRALGASNQVFATQDSGAGIVLSSRGAGIDTALAAARKHAAMARSAGLLLAPEGESIRVLPRKPKA